MGDTVRPSIAAVYTALLDMQKDVDEIKHDIKCLNDTVRDHSVDIALLKERQEGNKNNWSKVWDVLKPILVALITAIVMRSAP